MKTEDLISALAADSVHGASPGRRIAMALAGGLLVSGLLFQLTLGVRKDIAAAVATWRFDLKMALLVAAVGLAVLACYRAAAPQMRKPGRVMWIMAVALAVAVGIEMTLVGPSAWLTRLVGSNAATCLVAIPSFSLIPLALLLLAMRAGAPASSLRAGALAGLAAASAGAALYGLHCFDDSPLFVATWYPLASVPIVALGAIAGRWLLKW